MRRFVVALASLALLVVPTVATSSPYTGAEACPDFPADNVWHADVSRLPVHPRSADYVAAIGAGAGMHADFGSGQWDGGPIGIPYATVGAGQAKVPVSFDYADESDAGPYPIPADAPIEGGPSAGGDRHVLVVDRDACTLYEVFDAHPVNGGSSWTAGSGAVFDLRSNGLRPAGWTSADAAGLPILAGLVRYDEVASGHIDHAIRITVPRSDRSYVWPARHQAGAAADPSLPPMGLRLRLKAGVDTSSYPPADRVILDALKTYGAIVADNGSPWYVSGVPDERWDNDALHLLGQIKGSDWEAVDASSLQASPDSAAVTGGPAPADPQVARARVAGSDRVGTALALSKAVFPEGGTPTAVLASSASFADALAAAPLAGAATGPVLLNGPGSLDPRVADELRRLGTHDVYLAGGPSALSGDVERSLRDMGLAVVRLAGPDRYATAAALAREATARWRSAGDDAAGHEVLVAEGVRGWPDALAAGPWAASAHRPLLLVTATGVPDATKAAMADFGTTGATVLGGTAVVPDAVLADLPAQDRSRVAGDDRYETAAQLADRARQGGADPDVTVFATGVDWPDGLAAGPFAVRRGGVLLLTLRDAVPAAASQWLRGHPCGRLRVAGGPQAVSDEGVRALISVSSSPGATGPTCDPTRPDSG